MTRRRSFGLRYGALWIAGGLGLFVVTPVATMLSEVGAVIFHAPWIYGAFRALRGLRALLTLKLER